MLRGDTYEWVLLCHDIYEWGGVMTHTNGGSVMLCDDTYEWVMVVGPYQCSVSGRLSVDRGSVSRDR